MARNRKRAKERRARRPQSVTAAARVDHDAAPEPIEHAAPDVELAQAQLALGRPENVEDSAASEAEFERAGATPGRVPGGRCGRWARRSFARLRLRATRTRSPASARLAVRGVAPAPATVFAQLQSLGIVALALIRLVVPALAVLAGEGGSDPDVSTGHVFCPRTVV